MKLMRRYRSTMHGRYGVAGLLSGAAVGLLMGLYVLLRLLLGDAAERPVSLTTDIIAIVCIGLLMARYRGSLPEGKITLKEAMLFGLTAAATAGVAYGLCVWGCGSLSEKQVLLFIEGMMGKPWAEGDGLLRYWAAWWGIVSAVETAVVGALGAFVASLFLRNEKAERIN